MSQLTICTFSLQYCDVFRCLLRKTLFLTYQLMSSSCLTVPVCPIKFETSRLFARQAGYVSFTIVSSDWYLFFQWITERLRINAPLCFQQPNDVWHHIQAGFPVGHLWSEFWWISQGAWRIDHFIHTEGSEQFEAGQVTPEPTGEVVKVSCQTTRGR